MTSARAPRLELSITAEGPLFPPDQQHRLIDIARVADQAGADYIDTSEHVLMGLGAVGAGQGWQPEHLDMPQPESLTTLAAFLGATQRIKILSSVVIAPLRPAGLLAKQAATLHALSRGRFVMGVTASWHADEYGALGRDFRERGQVLDDTIGACRALWTAAPASFHSPTVNFDNMFCSPRPATGDRLPVWFGGKFTPRQVRRVVELGDGWMPWGGLRMSVDAKRQAVATLCEQYEQAGRDPATLVICDSLRDVDGSVERSLAQVPALAEAGINVFRVNLRRFTRSSDEALPLVEQTVRLFEQFRTARVF
jgi:probable F420-dependent oxidoreductase